MSFRYDVATIANQFRSERFPDGINRASWLGEQCGLASPSTYVSIFTGRNQGEKLLAQIGLPTMERLCDGLDCAVGDFLIAHEESLPAEGAKLAAARKTLALSPTDFAARLHAATGFYVDAGIIRLWETGQIKIREGIWQAIAEMALKALPPITTRPRKKASKLSLKPARKAA